MTPQRCQRIRSVLDRRQPDFTVILEGVHKTHNLSAIQRTCDAVGILEIHAIMPARRYRTHKRTASGSAKWVRVHSHSRVNDALSSLSEKGFHIVAAHLSDRATDFRQIDYTLPTAVLLGTEKYGVSDDALSQVDGEITIPMRGMVASLNVSVAAALVLYEAQRQRELAGMYARARLEPALCQELLFEWGYPRLAARYRALHIPYPGIGPAGEILDAIPGAIRLRL